MSGESRLAFHGVDRDHRRLFDASARGRQDQSDASTGDESERLSRYSLLDAYSCLGAAFGPPLETPTIAGRSTRSPIVQPLCTTWETVPDGNALVGRLENRLVKIGIELLALRVELLHPVPAERGFQIPRGQFDALDQRADRGIGARARFRRQMLERPRKVVDHGQHVARKPRYAISLGVGDLAFRAPAQILHLRQSAQHTILQLRIFGVKRLDDGETVRFIALGLSAFGRTSGLGRRICAPFGVVITHRFMSPIKNCDGYQG